MTAIVFSGPTLAAREIASRLDAICLPPARQGDIWRAVRSHRPRAIGLIDGLFLDVPSVWHRELLAALSLGVHVFGAASMGALRAAELHGFGMRGIGHVFAAYRDGRWPGFDDDFEDDDEVAVIHAPVEAGAAPLSDAMVDLRATLAAAAADGVIEVAASQALAAGMKRLHFSERSLQVLQAMAPALIGVDAAARLAEWLPSGRVAQKRLDAIAMVAAMADFLRADPPRFRAGFGLSRALVWERFVTEAERGASEDAGLVLEALRRDPDASRQALRGGMERQCALRDAPEVEPAAVRAQLSRFRQERGLARHADIEFWMAANGMDAAGLARLLREEAALDALAESDPSRWEAASLDQLRLTGRFVALLERVGQRNGA